MTYDRPFPDLLDRIFPCLPWRPGEARTEQIDRPCRLRASILRFPTYLLRALCITRTINTRPATMSVLADLKKQNEALQCT